MNLRVGVPLMLGSVLATGAAATAMANGQSVSPHPKAASVTVSPRTGLVGGERVHVVLRGFPPDVGVGISECPSASDARRFVGCDDTGPSLSTDASGSAEGTFPAQIAAQAAKGAALTVCTTRCVIAAAAYKEPVLAISSPLSFRVHRTGGLVDSSLIDLSWVSSEAGFALAGQPCTKGVCAVLATTTDAGAHWHELPPTPALVQSPSCSGRPTTTQCVDRIAFVSRRVGYLFGPAMFMTTDGGHTWQPASGPLVASLAVGDGQAFRVAYPHSGCPGPCTTSIQVAPVGTTAWRTVLTGLPDGTVGRFQILVSGADVYVSGYGDLAQGAGTQRAFLYRSADGGSSFVKLTDPCVGKLPTLHVLTALAAAPGGVLEGVCTKRAGAGDQYLVASTDAGSAWRRPRPLPAGTAAQLAAASASTIAVAAGAGGGSGTWTTKLLVSTDGGAAWKTAAIDTFQLGTAGVSWLGFETSQVGWWAPDPHRIFTTTDGGAHWVQTPFG